MYARIKEDEVDGLLYQMIDIAKDNLTVNNVPSNPCPICLIHFNIQDKFVKTGCFHHFHAYCIKEYIDKYEPEELSLIEQQRQQYLGLETTKKTPEGHTEEVPCPTCRKMTSFNKEEISNSIRPHDDDVVSFVCVFCNSLLLSIKHKIVPLIE